MSSWIEQAHQQISPLKERDWTGVKIALLLLALPWGGAAMAYHWIATVPDLPNCQSPDWSQAELERLRCLQTQMQSGDDQQLVAGIHQLSAWPQHSPLYRVAQRMLEDWSVVVWSQAQAHYEAGEWELSSRLIAEIPQQFDVWEQAQHQSNLWQKVREQGDVLYRRAEAAIQAQDWKAALERAQELAGLDNDYWRRQGLHELPVRIEAQQAAAQGADPLAQLPVAPQKLPQNPGSLALLSSSQLAADPRSTRSRTLRPVGRMMISLTKPTVTGPGQRPPEFSAA